MGRAINLDASCYSLQSLLGSRYTQNTNFDMSHKI